MSAQAITVTVDCTDAQALASWYLEAFGGDVLRDAGSFVVTRLREMPLNLAFQQVSEAKQGKNRTHLDFVSDHRETEVQRLVDLGASEIVVHTDEPYTWTVLMDPQGNEFCILQQPSVAAGASTEATA